MIIYRICHPTSRTGCFYQKILLACLSETRYFPSMKLRDFSSAPPDNGVPGEKQRQRGLTTLERGKYISTPYGFKALNIQTFK
jgi:hypothetical protein